MAGVHRSTDAAGYTARMHLRLPPDLKACLEHVASRHNRSANDEVVNTLMAKYQPRSTPLSPAAQQRALLDLEPQPGDTRTPLEIARQIAKIKGQRPARVMPESELEEVEIDWLPGTEGDHWNESATPIDRAVGEPHL